jgi:hypothetical protein
MLMLRKAFLIYYKRIGLGKISTRERIIVSIRERIIVSIRERIIVSISNYFV